MCNRNIEDSFSLTVINCANVGVWQSIQVNVKCNSHGVDSKLSVLRVERLEEHTAKDDGLGIFVQLLKVLNKNYTCSGFFEVSGEGGERHTDVVQILL